ncbi:putative HMP/thiamine permease protein YkoC [Thermogemmatispora aurantia]|uniref:Putative HMP/thiamine permease protein YkoC n=1 Tax=Thermogemmatispora aurantia TaxID=2045279 RepID=A0A5J4K860_9CHLR|nr:energy-coupling factor transporter transmembrane component T [Thermogemmatispora aurantia]GER84804.1 putative HMP/thiamine permease protein YkoC [Thermogemmatispora aurantia]
MQVIYQEGESLLHRLNPLSKVVAVVPVLLFVALTTDPWLPLAFTALASAVIVGPARISPGTFWRLQAPLTISLLVFLILYPFMVRAELFDHTPVVLRLGPLALYQGAVLAGMAAVLRVYAMFLLSLIFMLTTEISDFIRAMVQQWRFPYRLGYGILAAFHFMPLLQEEFRLIQAAHRIRGIETHGGVRVHIERLRRYLIPLLTSAIRRAERTALAMESRAFGALKQRSYFRRFRFSRADYLFILCFWLLCLLVIALFLLNGWMGPLSFTKEL